MARLKRIRLYLLAAAVVYFFWLGFQIIAFRVPEGPSSPVLETEIQGVYHVHTSLSDGRANPERAAEIAAQEEVDFMILADHGRPNRESLAQEGWSRGVLVLAGSEMSVSRGHLVALGFQAPRLDFSHDADLAAREVAAKGGFSIVAHPYSKVAWTWGRDISFSGLEIMNSDTMIKNRILQFLPYLPALFIRPRFALLKMLDFPEKNLRKWDMLCEQTEVYSYFSTDAHFLYRPLFSLFRLHLILEEPLENDFARARDQVYGSLTKGRFFNSIDGAAPASGFRFDGSFRGRRIHMGESVSFANGIRLEIRAPFGFPTEIRLIRNGEIILSSREKSMEFPPDFPGIYRVEIYLKAKSPLGKNIPWIVSNPIFLRDRQQ